MLGLGRTFAASMSIWACSVMAQGGLGFLKESPLSLFTEQDFNLMKTAAAAVLSSSSVGKIRSWKDPANGNAGNIQLLGSFSASDGRTCKRLRIENHAQGMSGVYTTIVCRAGDGVWRIDPEAGTAH